MADIKNSVLFQKKKKNPLDKIKEQNTRNQERYNSQNTNDVEDKAKEEVSKQVMSSSIQKVIKKKKVVKKSSKGAQDRFLDKVLKSSSSVRLSAVVNSILKLLTEKYAADKTKDEIMREALNEYVVTHLEKDDRILLLKDLEKDLDLFRQKNPTVSLTDEYGKVIKGKEEVENETLEMLREGFKLK